MLYALDDCAVVLQGEGHFIAPGACLIGKVRLETQTSVWFNAVLRGDHELIHLGACSNVQDNAVLHTDPGFPLTLGCGVTVGHQAMLHGCDVGDFSLIGIQSLVLNGARIGKHCLIGAQTLIPEGMVIPEGSLVMGTPGRVVRALSDAEKLKLEESSAHYVNNAMRYRKNLSLI